MRKYQLPDRSERNEPAAGFDDGLLCKTLVLLSAVGSNNAAEILEVPDVETAEEYEPYDVTAVVAGRSELMLPLKA